MKRFVATARGRVQRVSYREHVYNETFERNISGYVMNLKNGEVEIVAEGSEKDLRDFINEINIIRRPIAVKSFTVRWEEATGEYADFEIIRGDIQEETFERMDYAGNVLHSMDMKLDQSLQLQRTMLDKQDQMLDKQDQMLDKQDQMLDKQDQMLDKQDQSLQIGRETKEEIVGLRSDTRKHLDDEFGEIRKELVSIKEALARAGIQV
ncbi:acylphosphatase [Methanofollis tationis]|uniref:acylphosphatase n=1 Tax=Methanofollis tationis TaxID=81417 RepID=A0A7K4HLN7_9EURY|nr:acylphosphatase [Methanofollis tationis]NVO65967.1 acylphosphatase [Methanofollis tationis]